MKKTILVSGASGIVGYGILRSLQQYKSDYHLIGTTIYKESIAPAFCDSVELALPTSDDNYITWLCNIIKKHQVDMIIPGIDCDMYCWNQHRRTLESMGVSLLLNAPKLIELCQNKWTFYQTLIDVIPTYLIPTTNNLTENIYGFPFILKPKEGFGSKGIFKITNELEYHAVKEKISDALIMQPIVGNDEEEYTVSGFFDNQHNLVDFLAFKRKLSLNGYTEVAQVVDYDFSQILIEIATVVKPIGATNFQFRLVENEMKLLEINPRISSSTSIRAALGYNESQMSINYFLFNRLPSKLDKHLIKDKKAIRYVEEHIF